MVLGGAVVDDEQLAALQPHSSLAIAEGLNLMQEDDDPAQFGNHSCEPNLWMADEITVVARRAIEPGEELTIDYALMTVVTWTMECRCGTRCCRGLITGDDWRLPELRRRYRGRFSPFINDRIRRLERV
ncbi:MAG: SET domain-containing protein-lysine N-methyltransferase [Chloroflexi bacterium]|nr:SET domain-containing protein-lysine N-methyltransferase [Chloroflexota bacterium]